MASLTLLQWILGALLLQVAAFMGLAFGRHWQAYAALREAAAKGQLAALAGWHRRSQPGGSGLGRLPLVSGTGQDPGRCRRTGLLF